jgi:hypothetical protein
MPLPWATAQQVYDGGMLPEERQSVTSLLNQFGDVVAPLLTQAGFPVHASPLWRPWNLIVVKDSEKLLAAFTSLQGGISTIRWVDKSAEKFTEASLISAIMNELGAPVVAVINLPLPGSQGIEQGIVSAAMRHVSEVEHANRLGRLGDLTGLSHLEPHLRSFLEEHPDPSRNVFVMMRFIESPQMNGIYSAIKDSCSAYGFHAVRADDRDYTGELWSNIEVYMTCCQYGVAVFEDIDKRDFNPNVSLELGYMMGRRKRTLILKEKRLPDLPADVIHRLYKPFDMFAVSETVSREVGRWIEVDLGIPRLTKISLGAGFPHTHPVRRGR